MLNHIEHLMLLRKYTEKKEATVINLRNNSYTNYNNFN